MKRMRLLSYLMRTGRFARAWDAEQEILAGRILVNGDVLRKPQYSVRQSNNVTWVRGRNRIELKLQEPVYILMNKPAGCVCQKTRGGEKTVFDVIDVPLDPGVKRSLFTIGRLDRDTTGLLIITNDGQLQRLMTQAKVPKTYRVRIQRPARDQDIKKLLEGVQIRDDDTGRLFSVRAISAKRVGNELELVIDEGRKRQVKKMLEAVENRVTGLERTAIGELALQDVGFHGKRCAPIVRLELLKRIRIRKPAA